MRWVDAHVVVGRREVRGDELVSAFQALGEVDELLKLEAQVGQVEVGVDLAFC